MWVVYTESVFGSVVIKGPMTEDQANKTVTLVTVGQRQVGIPLLTRIEAHEVRELPAEMIESIDQDYAHALSIQEAEDASRAAGTN